MWKARRRKGYPNCHFDPRIDLFRTTIVMEVAKYDTM